MTEQNHAYEQAEAQGRSISAMVAALNVDYDRLEELRAELKEARLVGWNMPGYMPDSAPFIVADADDARNALADEMEERADQIEESADLESEDDNGRDDCEDVRADVAEMRALRDAAAALRRDDCEEYGQTIGHTHYWFNAAESLADEDDAKELAELEEQAGDCESEDDARQRIEEDALEVSVRSDWHSPGEQGEPDQFRILLCTGGPAVQIRGELRNGEPYRAWLEYQDWFTPWAEYHGDAVSQEDLLTYSRCFYFGE